MTRNITIRKEKLVFFQSAVSHTRPVTDFQVRNTPSLDVFSVKLSMFFSCTKFRSVWSFADSVYHHTSTFLKWGEIFLFVSESVFTVIGHSIVVHSGYVASQAIKELTYVPQSEIPSRTLQDRRKKRNDISMTWTSCQTACAHTPWQFIPSMVGWNMNIFTFHGRVE